MTTDTYRGYTITYHWGNPGVTAVATHRYHETQSVAGLDEGDVYWLVLDRIDEHLDTAPPPPPTSDPRVVVSVSLALIMLFSCTVGLAIFIHLSRGL